MTPFWLCDAHYKALCRFLRRATATVSASNLLGAVCAVDDCKNQGEHYVFEFVGNLERIVE